MNYWLKCLKQSNDYKSRASRKEFWIFILISTFICTTIFTSEILEVYNLSLIAITITPFLGITNGVMLLEHFIVSFIVLFVITPGLAVAIRRMHDIGKNGWYILVPFYNFILFLREGDKDNNKYGQNPITCVSNPNLVLFQSEGLKYDSLPNSSKENPISKLIYSVTDSFLPSYKYFLLMLLVFIVGNSGQLFFESKDINDGKRIHLKYDYYPTTFRNGDPLVRASNLAEYKKACRNKQPAFLVASTIFIEKTVLLLYNAYALIDKRELAPEGYRIQNIPLSELSTIANEPIPVNQTDEYPTYQIKFVKAFELKSSSINNLQSVKIGNQIWTTKNLDVSNYRNGDPIRHVSTHVEWEDAIKKREGAWCYYNHDPKNGEIYGKLYNWFCVDDERGLAPADYHIPSDSEWYLLSEYLGGNSVAGYKIKSTSRWDNGGNGDNSSGFNALPGGYCKYDGNFYSMYGNGYFWSSSAKYFTNNAWSLNLYNNNTKVFRGFNDKGSALSVRCLRD
jgi:uncharacterized protein (TIGR02145 family)